MSEPVRWGILSTADINSKLIPGAQASPDVDLIGVASRDHARARAFADRWNIERAYGTYEELLADPDIEAVYIPLPNTLHCDWSIRALESGKHVLCEKPLSRHVDEVQAAFDTAERCGRLLSEAFMYRHAPQTARLRELVTEGAVGTLRLIRSSFSYSLYDENDIRLRPELEGGGLMDVGCYCVSGSRLLAGEPELALGHAWFGPTGTDWMFAGILRFPEDVIAYFDCGTALVDRNELEVVGSEGSLFVVDPWHCGTPGIELRRGERVEHIGFHYEDPYRLELENLSAAIRGRGALLLGREDAVAQARALAALHEAAVTSSPVVP